MSSSRGREPRWRPRVGSQRTEKAQRQGEDQNREQREGGRSVAGGRLHKGAQHWHRGSAAAVPSAVAPSQSDPRTTNREGTVFRKNACSGGRSLQISLSPVAKIAAACTLHDRLRARERDVRIKPFGHQEVRAAHQEEPELRFTQLPVELSVPASRDINREDIL